MIYQLLINIIFLFILFSILIYLIAVKKPMETFMPGIFGTDPRTLPFTECRPENNCFPGTYARTQIYQNVCQPDFGLLRQKIPTNDNCQRTLLDYMNTPKNYYVCEVDNHLQRKCQWIKKK